MIEEKIRQAIEENKKLPKCVAIYDKLFKMITEGAFEREEKLPSEPELAKIMGVSRMTLRQALALLKEDGMIKNIHGKGNFIVKNTESCKVKGLETLSNPVYSTLDKEIDEVELEFKIELPSDYTIKVLGRKTSVVVYVDRWYKVQGEGVAYTLSILPIETITDENIDLTDKNNLLEFLEKRVYEISKNSSLKIGVSEAGNFTSMKYKIAKNSNSYLIEEKLYLRKEEYPLLHNKHYVPMEFSQLIIERKK